MDGHGGAIQAEVGPMRAAWNSPGGAGRGR